MYYFTGKGKPVKLREIGHLREVAEHYAYGLGTFHRLPGQIVRFAREHPRNPFKCLIENYYSFQSVQFSHGDGIVRVWVSGSVSRFDGMLEVRADILFKFSDMFENPLDGDKWGVGKFDLPYSTPYPVSGEWKGYLYALARKNHNESRYHSEWKKPPKYLGIMEETG